MLERGESSTQETLSVRERLWGLYVLQRTLKTKDWRLFMNPNVLAGLTIVAALSLPLAAHAQNGAQVID